MIIVRRILVPIDFGETSEAALTYGMEMTRMFAARLHLLHVFEVSTSMQEYPVAPFVPGVGDSHDQLTRLLSGADQRDLRPVCETRVGAPANEILGYAQEHDIDLIVMGTHGREGFERMLLGSVAETVVRKAACPVLTVHNRTRQAVMEPEHARASWRACAAS
jgi:nucleotide-binding universal stress UspA family protein